MSEQTEMRDVALRTPQELASVELSPSQSDTQEYSDPKSESAPDPGVWGSLVHFTGSNPHIQRMDFRRGKNSYMLGRGGLDDVTVDFAFEGATNLCEPSRLFFLQIRLTCSITNTGQAHCMIEWDGKETAESSVLITDLSERNGTWVSTGIALYFPSKHSPTFPTIALRVAA